MNLLTYVGLITNFAPAILGSVYWRKLAPEARWFTVMVWIIALNGLSGLGAEFLLESNMPFFHFYILVDVVLLLYVYSLLLNPFVKKKYLRFAAVFFSLVWTYNLIWGNGPLGYPTNILVVQSLSLMTVSTLWFVKVMREKTMVSPQRSFGFWLSTGVLIFYSGNLLLYIFSNYIFLQAKHVYIAIWGTHAILVILLYFFYTIAIIWARKTPISS